ncbi:MAG TPA: GAP family protein [Anaerolineae bacterium]|nr:GAP family protein [Anaerolineae bacterium]
MDTILLDLLPLILGASLAPLYPIVVLLLLLGEGGLRTAVAFVAGVLTIRLAQGLLFGWVFGAAAQAHPDDGPQVIAATLLLVVGILLLLTGFKKWRKQPDPDDPPPQWMAALGGLSPLKAFRAGALFVTIAVKQWVFTLTALDVIQGAALDGAAGVGLYLLFTLATQVVVLLPILVYAVAPQQSARPLRAAQGWLERNNRPIVIGVSLIFGVWFFYKGVTGLIG